MAERDAVPSPGFSGMTATPSMPTPPSTTAAAKAATTSPGRSAILKGRSFLNHQQRLEIIKKKDSEPKWTQVQLARWAAVHFGLPKEPSQATIAVLLKKRDKLTAATVRPQTRTIRAPRHPELEAALLLWIRHLQSQRTPFTGESIRLKASFLAQELGIETRLNFSTGWMSGFVNRHNLTLARAHKKRPPPHEFSDAGDEVALRQVLQAMDPRNVFAMDETALIYNDLPLPPGDEYPTANPERDSLCVGLTVNMNGSEKLEPLIVTTSRHKFAQFPECYFNVDGEMTARIFEQWLYKLNQRMAATNRKIVLVVPAVSSHFPVELSHVRLVLLSHLTLPLAAGIVKSFKALYRRTHLSFAVDQAEDGRPHIFDVALPRALQWVKQAWQEVSSELIRNCWARTDLLTGREQLMAMDVAEIHPEVVQSLVVSLSQLQLLENVPIETLLQPRSEENVHYVYHDNTVVRLVMEEAVPVEASPDEDMTYGSGSLDPEDPHAPTRIRGAINSTGSSSRIGRAHSDDGFHHPYEIPPSPSDLLTHYRAVIWSLDAEADGSEEHQIALRLLRKKQAALRHELHGHQQQLQPQQHQQQPHTQVPAEASAPEGNAPSEPKLGPSSEFLESHVL